MKKELLALILLYLDDRLESSASEMRSRVPQRGRRGPPGKDFNLQEVEDEIKNWISSIAPRFSDLTEDERESLRGAPGTPGRPGRDFSMEDHAEDIKTWIEERRPTFASLTEEEKESLRGTPGAPGSPGRDFNMEDHAQQIQEWIESRSLKFSDLTADQIKELRGEPGRNGHDFNMADHEDTIKSWIEERRLKFSDLTPEEVSMLKGEPGRRGEPGHDFNMAEHEETIKAWIEERRLKFSDLSEEEIESLRGEPGKPGRPGADFSMETHGESVMEILRTVFRENSEDCKLKFSDLSPEEKSLLKLTFNDLSLDEIEELRGPRGVRGPRGQKGKDGKDGKNGRNGIDGLPGINGKPGLNGKDGLDGEDGADAPYITDIKLEEKSDSFYFVFEFSDGAVIETNDISRPLSKIVETYIVGGPGGGGGGGGGEAGEIQVAYNGADIGPVSKIDFSDDFNLAYSATTKTLQVSVGAIPVEEPHLLIDHPCEPDVYVGAVVYMDKTATPVPIIDWVPIASADPLMQFTYAPIVGNAIASVPGKSRPIGICIAKDDATNTCTVTKSVTGNIYTGLDVVPDYFLSGDVAGGMVKEEDLALAPGSYKVRVGHAITDKKFLYDRGDRTLVV